MCREASLADLALRRILLFSDVYKNRQPVDFIDAQMGARYQRTADQSPAIADYPQLGTAGANVPLQIQFQWFLGPWRCLIGPKW